MKNKLTPESITFWQFSNVVPIVVSLFSVIMAFSATYARIAVLENKVDTIIAQNNEILTKYAVLQERVGKDELTIAKLTQIHPEIR